MSTKEVEVVVSPEDFLRYDNISVVFKFPNKTGNTILNFLKNDERQVVKEIINNEGLTQAKLLQKVSFSKPTLWRIIKNLETRGVIEREKYGKTYKLKCNIFSFQNHMDKIIR